MSNKLRIVVGSDVAGLQYKNQLRADFEADERVSAVIDVGVQVDESTAYPHVAFAAARLVATGHADRAYLYAVRDWAWPSARTRYRESVR